MVSAKTLLYLGGLAAGGYVVYKMVQKQKTLENALPAGTAPSSPASSPGSSLLPDGTVIPSITTVIPNGTPEPEPVNPKKGTGKVVEVKPGVIKEVLENGKTRKINNKRLQELLPPVITINGQQMPLPNDTALTGEARLHALQDYAEIGVANGWLVFAGTNKLGAPRWSIPGKKAKLTRGDAALWVKKMLVLAVHGE